MAFMALFYHLPGNLFLFVSSGLSLFMFPYFLLIYVGFYPFVFVFPFFCLLNDSDKDFIISIVLLLLAGSKTYFNLKLSFQK